MDNRISPILEDISLPAYELRQGMFVSNLDCGWGRTPFLIEGVLLKKQEEIDLIRSVAQYVTVDLVRSEDFALQDFLNGDSYRRRQLGDVEANTFSSQNTGNTNDIEPLTFDPRDAAAEYARINTESPSLAERLKALKSHILSLMRAKESDDVQADFPKSLRASYIPPDIDLVRHPLTEFSWPAVRIAQQSVKETIAALAEVTQTIERYRTIDERKIYKAAETLAEHMIHFPEAMIWASRLQQKDDNLLRRSLQAAIYLTAMGRYLGFPEKLLGELAAAGLLLDIGKTQIDAKLLAKPDTYTADEMKSAQRHVDISLSLLSDADSLPQNIKRAVAEHHEQINGDGYPKACAARNCPSSGKWRQLLTRTWQWLTHDPTRQLSLRTRRSSSYLPVPIPNGSGRWSSNSCNPSVFIRSDPWSNLHRAISQS